MRRFKFSLESVLNLKIAEEKQAKGEVAAAQNRVNALEQHKAQLEANLQRAQDSFKEEAKHGLTPDDFRINYEYFDAQRRLIRGAQMDIGKAKEALAQKQARLVEINREKKTLEKLREEKYAEHMREENAREAKELEDILLPKMTGAEGKM
ncbi:MAG: flagellar export protein FliJ [Oscillospiraceae bacterium]|nr:flagellar export protein FliJ [Oscillospiraceae bacterium]MBR5261198.1 flagellar export protein FliJ [Oscillospiraceae bacterium]